MNDLALRKLESEWESAFSEKDWKMLGKVLRCLANVLKSCDSHTEYEAILAERKKFLEESLEEMDGRSAIAVIGDLRHVERHAKLRASGEFGSALKQRLSSRDRAKIKRKNRSPELSVRYEHRYGASFSDSSDGNGVCSGDMGDDEA